MTCRSLFYVFVAAATAALVLNPDEQVRTASRSIDDQPILLQDSTPNVDVSTPDPVAALVPLTTEGIFRADAKAVETSRMKVSTALRHSYEISDPIPVEETGRENWPDVVQIGEPIDADAPVAESADAPNPLPIEIGRIFDANETEVWDLPRTSTEVIDIGTPLDADSPWPDQNQERESVDIGPPIEAEGLGSLL